MIYLKERDYQSAVLIFEKLISLYPEDLGFKELYIEALILNRKIDEAKKYLYAQPEEIKEKIYQRRKDLFCRVKTNNFKFYYSYFNLSPSYRKSEKEYGVELSQHLNQWVFLISTKKFERFGLEDNQLYMEIYPYLGKTRWGYFSFSYSPDASFLPKTTYGFEIFQSLNKFEISFGYNHMNFKDSNVDMFFPGFILYLPKDFILEEKLYLVPKTNSYSLVTTISKEVVCKLSVKYSFGFGTISE
jgi:YaiO family outer membrane protein